MKAIKLLKPSLATKGFKFTMAFFVLVIPLFMFVIGYSSEVYVNKEIEKTRTLYQECMDNIVHDFGDVIETNIVDDNIFSTSIAYDTYYVYLCIEAGMTEDEVLALADKYDGLVCIPSDEIPFLYEPWGNNEFRDFTSNINRIDLSELRALETEYGTLEQVPNSEFTKYYPTDELVIDIMILCGILGGSIGVIKELIGISLQNCVTRKKLRRAFVIYAIILSALITAAAMITEFAINNLMTHVTFSTATEMLYNAFTGSTGNHYLVAAGIIILLGIICSFIGGVLYLLNSRLSTSTLMISIAMWFLILISLLVLMALKVNSADLYVEAEKTQARLLIYLVAGYLALSLVGSIAGFFGLSKRYSLEHKF